MSRVEGVMSRMERICEKAIEQEHWTGAVGASRELRGCLELLGKLSGELQTGGSRVAVNFGDITKIDIRELSQDQLDALCSRWQESVEDEVRGMSAEEVKAKMCQIALEHSPGLVTERQTILFDDVTVPPGLGIEANRRYNPKKSWRNASPADRYRMMQAAWKRETGEDLTVEQEDLGPFAVIEIKFNFSEERDWMEWPEVCLKRFQQAPPQIEGIR